MSNLHAEITGNAIINPGKIWKTGVKSRKMYLKEKKTKNWHLSEVKISSLPYSEN